MKDEHVKYSYHKKSVIWKIDLSEGISWYNAKPYFFQQLVVALALAANVGLAFAQSSMSDTHFASASDTSVNGSVCNSFACAVHVRTK
jgi:hypothetical protein